MKDSTDATAKGKKPKLDKGGLNAIEEVLNGTKKEPKAEKTTAKPKKAKASATAAAEAAKTLDDQILEVDGAYPRKEFVRDKMDGFKNPDLVQPEGNWDAFLSEFSRSPSIDGFMPLMTHYSAAQVNAGGRVVTRRAPKMKVNTVDLYEEGFANPASAQTEFAVDQLTQLRIYQDALNASPQNSTALINFV